MQKLAGILNESQYEAKKQMLNEEVIDFTNQEQFSDFLQNKTGELEGKKVKLNIFDTFSSGDAENEKFIGDITVSLNKRTGGSGNLKFDATLIDDGGYKYISSFKGKQIVIVIPSTTGGKGVFDGDFEGGLRGLFKVKSIEIL